MKEVSLCSINLQAYERILQQIKNFCNSGIKFSFDKYYNAKRIFDNSMFVALEKQILRNIRNLKLPPPSMLVFLK